MPRLFLYSWRYLRTKLIIILVKKMAEWLKDLCLTEADEYKRNCYEIWWKNVIII